MEQRTERIVVVRPHPNWEACRRLCSQARRLGNCAVYILRHNIFEKKPSLTRAQFDRRLRNEYEKDYRAMPSAASAQKQGFVVVEQFASYAAAKKEYAQNPEKFTGAPRLPGYKKKYRTFYVARNGYKIENHNLSITGGPTFGFHPIIVRCVANQIFNAPATLAKAGDLRIVPKGNSFIIELTYKLEISEKNKA